MSEKSWQPPQIHYTPYSAMWFFEFAHVDWKTCNKATEFFLATGANTCMICGSTEDISDYPPKESPITLRLCDACHDIQEKMKERSYSNGH